MQSKSITTTTLLTSLLLSGALLITACGKQASGGEMSQACTDYTEKTKALMSKNPQMAAMFEKSLEQTKDNWSQLSTEEQDKLNEMCVKGLDQLKQIEEIQAKAGQ